MCVEAHSGGDVAVTHDAGVLTRSRVSRLRKAGVVPVLVSRLRKNRAWTVFVGRDILEAAQFADSRCYLYARFAEEARYGWTYYCARSIFEATARWCSFTVLDPIPGEILC